MTPSEPESDTDLVGELEALEGLAVTPGEDLSRHTTLRIGGPADLFVEIGAEDALVRALGLVADRRLPFQLLGLGSNVLIPDEGLPGLVAVLTGDFREVRIEGSRVETGAALPLARLARRCLDHGLVGLEPLSGFPSTVGGAVVMNAGCYGVEIQDVLVEADVVWPGGRAETLATRDLEPGYRSTRLLGSGAIVTRARLQLEVGDPSRAKTRLAELQGRRRSSMPMSRPNAGSVFKNPEGDYAGRLVEECGLKGHRCGGARISLEHANVVVNEGSARASEVLELMATAHRAVRKRFGVDLEPELILVGRLAETWSCLTAQD